MAYNTIKIKKYSDVIEEFTLTAVAVTPGMLVEHTSTALTVQKHSTAGGNVTPPMFVLEDELQGDGIDTNIAASQKAQVWIPYRGDMVYAWLKDGQNVAIGDALESAGDGTLQKHTADAEQWDSASAFGSITVYPNQIVGVATEAVDLSASANTANGRIVIRIV